MNAHLTALAAHTRKWSPKINLVAKSTLAEVEQRHVQDSTQLSAYLPDLDAKIVDLGSGGGFPGLALVCLGYRQVTLVDSDSRKMSACRAFLRERGLSATLLTTRIEALDFKNQDVVTARALAPLDQLLGWAVPLLGPEGRCLFLKGAQAEAEIEEAKKRFDFQLKIHDSLSSPEGSVLELSHVQIRLQDSQP